MINLLNKYNKVIRIKFFVAVFLLMGALVSSMLERPFLDDAVFLYTAITFLIVWFNYYVLSKIIFGIKNPVKWIILTISMILLYFISLYALTFPFKSMNLLYPNDEKIIYFYEGLYMTSFEALVSPRGPALLSSQLYMFLFLFFAGTMVFRYIESMKKITALELCNANQKLDLLKSQIHPEFLFNTLKSLNHMTRENKKANEVVSKLSDLLKFTLYESNVTLISLKSELTFLKDFIELEKIRHHDHVKIQYDFSDIKNEDIQISPLLFINFIENAFKHGVNKTRGSSWVNIILIQKEGGVDFNISNNTPKINRSVHDTNGGKGLLNITRRLQLLYPDKHQLTIDNQDEVYSVHLKIDLT